MGRVASPDRRRARRSGSSCSGSSSASTSSASASILGRPSRGGCRRGAAGRAARGTVDAADLLVANLPDGGLTHNQVRRLRTSMPDCSRGEEGLRMPTRSSSATACGRAAHRQCRSSQRRARRARPPACREPVAHRSVARGLRRSRCGVPGDAVERAVAAVVEEARRQTQALVELPEGEDVAVEIVHDQPWLAFCQYLRTLQTKISVNVDLPISAIELLTLAIHETYPGHHTERCCRRGRRSSGVAVSSRRRWCSSRRRSRSSRR